MTLVKKVIQKNLCIGCGYCAAQAGTGMHHDAAGFLVPDPQTDSHLSDTQRQQVQAACPGINGDSVVSPGATPRANAEGSIEDPMWGRYFQVITAWSTHPEIRHAGSSGGALTALARWLVDSGRVDSVLVTQYDPDYAIGTRTVLTNTPEDLLAGAGSKYCPAAPLAALQDLADRPGRHAVIGRPCDIATIRRAIAAGDPLGSKIALLLSFFCAGTPSDAGNRALLERIGMAPPEDLTSFRHRGQGWPGETRAVSRTGKTATCTYGESWGQVLRRHVHTLCKICPDGIGEQADIVAADAWYGDDDGYPLFDEADGRSLVLARTKLGHDLLQEALTEGALDSEPLDIREIDRMQPGQLNRRRQLAQRITAFRLTGQAVPRYARAALRGYQSGLGRMTRAKMLAASIRRRLKRS